KKFPLGFKPYYPDGAYFEGPSYWFYATNYFALSLSAFESTLGTDFDFINAEGIKKSAVFTEVTAGPSGDYYNFFDASLKGYRDMEHIGLLAWFSNRMGKNLLGDINNISETKAWNKPKPHRLASLHAIFLAQMSRNLPEEVYPKAWLAKGNSPIGVLRPKDENGLYLAAKGGSADDNHSNMDAGSFILEWKKIRWSVDLGNQDYKTLEAIMGTGSLWNRAQDSERWNLLTKNNYGHSTLTVNNALYNAKARSLVIASSLEAETPYFSFDLSPLFGKNTGQVNRKFKQISDQKVQVIDEIQINENTREIRWQMITTAKVKIQKDGALLSQKGASLGLGFKSNQEYEVKITNLDPPPLDYDKQIPGLKRLDFIIKPNLANGEKVNITVDFIGK
ncbi:MAG: heparinase II/III family protein, partial [Bacteroidota bacterium]